MQTAWNIQILRLKDNNVSVFIFIQVLWHILSFFNAVAASTFVYYKHEVCLITITKTSVLLYMPFLKWVFLCLPSGIIESKFGFCILYGFLALQLQELFCSWLLPVLKFIQCGWEKIKGALYFVIKQTLRSSSYGLQAALMRGRRNVPEEGFRTKLSSISIPRSWKNGALSLVRGSGMHTIASIAILLLFFFWKWEREKEKKLTSWFWNYPYLQFERSLLKKMIVYWMDPVSI